MCRRGDGSLHTLRSCATFAGLPQADALRYHVRLTERIWIVEQIEYAMCLKFMAVAAYVDDLKFRISGVSCLTECAPSAVSN